VVVPNVSVELNGGNPETGLKLAVIPVGSAGDIDRLTLCWVPLFRIVLMVKVVLSP
jgi:hypothetical protein